MAVRETVAVTTAGQRWEYRQVVVRDGLSAEGPLNTAGDEGWELAAALPGNAGVTFVLKRPR